LLLSACRATSPEAPTPGAIGFEGAEPGAWRADSTGGAGPAATWQARPDSGAISPPNVLSLTATNHASDDRFNVYWSPDVRFGDGRLTLSVRADAGEVDQGGGPVWRVQDANNYYVCRFNPLETNYRVYVVQNGVRKQLATAMVDIATGKWHRIEVQHIGDRITCWLDGKELLQVTDTTLPAPGGVGVWTKADALTSFDDLAATAVLP
jgi:hypothetical protein